MSVVEEELLGMGEGVGVGEEELLAAAAADEGVGVFDALAAADEGVGVFDALSLPLFEREGVGVVCKRRPYRVAALAAGLSRIPTG